MRVLFASSPGVGHVLPMLGLALTVRERGHAIAWATAREAWPLVAAHGIEAFDAGAPFAQCAADYRTRWPPATSPTGREGAAHAFAHLFGEIVAPRMLPGLDLAIAAWRPTLVVNETAALAAPLAAHRHGIKHVTHAYGLPVPASAVRAASDIMAPLWHSAGLAVPEFAGLYEHLAIEIVPPSLQAMCPNPVLAQRVLRQRAASITGTATQPLPPSLQDFLNAGDTRPLVYVTFGTLFDRSPNFESLPQALATINARFVVTSGVADAPGAMTAANTWRGGYVPLHLVLPRCDAVVSHAGSGTVLAAIEAGLPQLCLPQGADQFRNADALVATGAALSLEGEQCNAPSVRGAVMALLTQARWREAAARLALEVRDMSTVADGAIALEALACEPVSPASH